MRSDEKRKKVEDAARAVHRAREKVDAMRLQRKSNDPTEREQRAVDLMMAETEWREARYAFWVITTLHCDGD